MMHIQTKIQRWGNSLAIRLTGMARTVPRFSENMPVDIEISEEGLHIKPMLSFSKKLPFTEAELLQGMTPASAHIEALAEPTLQEIDNEKLYPGSQ